MSTLYDAFMPFVYPMLPHVPEPSAIIAVRNACIEFCRGSEFLQIDMDPISTAAGIGLYEVSTPKDTVLTRVVTLYCEGRRLPRRTVSEVAARYSRDWQLFTGTPSAFTQFNPKEVTLVPTPINSVTNALTGRIAVVPSRTSTTVDDQVFERYLEVIVRGAVARLAAVPHEPFTDLKVAALNARQFACDIANARMAVTAGQTQAPMQVRPTRV